jgi:hypothetical protein
VDCCAEWRHPSTVVQPVRWGGQERRFPIGVRTTFTTAEVPTVVSASMRGQRVAMFYSSANFDSEVFDESERFDITRDLNPHLGFGGTGAHYCLGVSLARLEIGLMFHAIADHMPDIKKAGEPRRLRSGWLNGVNKFRVQYRWRSGPRCTAEVLPHPGRILSPGRIPSSPTVCVSDTVGHSKMARSTGSIPLPS